MCDVGSQGTDAGSRGQNSSGMLSAKSDSTPPRHGKGHQPATPAPAQPQVDLLLDLQVRKMSDSIKHPQPV